MRFGFSNYKPVPLIVTIGVLWTVSGHLLTMYWEDAFEYGIGPLTIVSIILFAYDRYLWKWPVLRWLVDTPDLNGNYEGCVEFRYDGDDKKKACTAVIEQTASTISATFDFTKPDDYDTKSRSEKAFFIKDNDGKVSRLGLFYENKGSAIGNDTLTQHHGISILDLTQQDGEYELKGSYFTNRKPKQTQGDIELYKTWR